MDMTKDEIRIAVAEAMGWTRMDEDFNPGVHGKTLFTCGTSLQGTPPCDKDKPEDDQAYEKVPNYPESLDACAEFERALTEDECVEYNSWLVSVIGPTVRLAKSDTWTWGALPMQRCEAFLRVKSLWREPAEVSA